MPVEGCLGSIELCVVSLLRSERQLSSLWWRSDLGRWMSLR
jgi:hypothetical protein